MQHLGYVLLTPTLERPWVCNGWVTLEALHGLELPWRKQLNSRVPAFVCSFSFALSFFLAKVTSIQGGTCANGFIATTEEWAGDQFKVCLENEQHKKQLFLSL
jgi:hypothetical protein